MRSKAKTLNELLSENVVEWIRMIITEPKAVESSSKFQEKWVKLEDAEEEQKQKLQQVIKNLEKKLPNTEHPIIRSGTYYEGYLDALGFAVKKLEELLENE